MIFGQKRWQSAVNCLDLREGLLARAPSRQWQASRQWQPLCRDLVNPLSLPHPTILQHTLCNTANTMVQIPMFCNGRSATFVYCTFAEGHYSGLSRQRSICEISPRKVQPKTAPDSVTPYTNLWKVQNVKENLAYQVLFICYDSLHAGSNHYQKWFAGIQEINEYIFSLTALNRL